MSTQKKARRPTLRTLFKVLLVVICAVGAFFAFAIVISFIPAHWPAPQEPIIPPNEGQLWVYVIGSNGSYVDAHVIVSNSSKSFSVTGGRTGPIPFDLDAGSYTVAGSSSSAYATPQNVTVVVGEQVDVTLRFGSSENTTDALLCEKCARLV